jgi:hypothetical protein
MCFSAAAAFRFDLLSVMSFVVNFIIRAYSSALGIDMQVVALFRE